MPTTYTSIAVSKVLEGMDEDTLKDITEYGCVSGCAPGFVYYHETSAFFDLHSEGIEDYLYELLGEEWMIGFAQKNNTIKGFKNAIVWAFVECVAQDVVHTD